MRPVIWPLTVGHAGFESQAIGLAEAIGGTVEPKRAEPRFPWSVVPATLALPPIEAARPAGCLSSPWPDVVVSCGRRVVGLALAIKRAGGGRPLAVHIQDPLVNPALFDLVAAPAHDRVRGENVVVTEGALHRVTPAKLEEAARAFAPLLSHLPRPLVAVLIGGSNRRYRLTPACVERLCDGLIAIARSHGAGLAITPSRRTDPKATRILQSRLDGLAILLWDGTGANPYLGMLAAADAVVVTADSVSMTSEAFSTGKPVYVFELEGGGGRFADFHDRARRAGYTRPFDGTLSRWSYSPPDDTGRVAVAVRALLAGRDRAQAPA